MIAGFTKRKGQKSENVKEYYSEVGELSLFGKFLSVTRIARCYDLCMGMVNKKELISANLIK